MKSILARAGGTAYPPPRISFQRFPSSCSMGIIRNVHSPRYGINASSTGKLPSLPADSPVNRVAKLISRNSGIYNEDGCAQFCLWLLGFRVVEMAHPYLSLEPLKNRFDITQKEAGSYHWPTMVWIMGDRFEVDEAGSQQHGTFRVRTLGEWLIKNGSRYGINCIHADGNSVHEYGVWYSGWNPKKKKDRYGILRTYIVLIDDPEKFSQWYHSFTKELDEAIPVKEPKLDVNPSSTKPKLNPQLDW